MLFTNLYVNIVIITYFYLTIYNLTLVGCFWIFLSFLNFKIRTLYSFNTFSFDSFFVFFLTLFLFSLAGVPPFIGFFNKLYLLNLISQSKFFIFNTLFLIILIFGLYFYMQNLRFLHSTNLRKSTKPFLNVERVSFFTHYYLVILAHILINGFVTVNFFLDFFSWLHL